MLANKGQGNPKRRFTETLRRTPRREARRERWGRMHIQWEGQPGQHGAPNFGLRDLYPHRTPGAYFAGSDLIGVPSG